MKFKRLLTMSLVASMLISVVGCTAEQGTPSSTAGTTSTDSGTASNVAEESAYPEWLNLEQTGMPIVAEGTDITLDIMVGGGANWGAPEDIWYWEFVRRELNIEPNVELVVAELAQKKNLAFNSGALPDILINCQIAPVELVNYGSAEQLLLPINNYMNEDLTPNLLALYEEDPTRRDLITLPDGNIYGIGMIAIDTLKTNEYYSPGGISDFRYNSVWFDQLGLEKPETVDDFFDVLREFKTLGEDIIPLGGSYAGSNTGMPIFMSALGLTTDTIERSYLEPSLNNNTGEVTFMYGDQELYKPFLEYYYTMFSEGLISRDYFTLDDAGQRALATMGSVGVLVGSTVGRLGENEMDYLTFEPLTSPYNEDKMWTDQQNNITVGGFSIAADTEYPELCIKFMDHHFDAYYSALQFVGPHETQPELFYDMLDTGWSLDGPMAIYRPWDIYGECSAWGQNFGYITNNMEIGHELEGTDPVPQKWENDSTAHLRRRTNMESLVPYTTLDRYPTSYLYLEQENINTITDLEGVINDYVEIEFAKFVTGERPITDEELAIYFEDLDNLGYQEYFEIYDNYYEDFKS